MGGDHGDQAFGELDGKLFAMRNTFLDLVAVGKYIEQLIERRLGYPAQLVGN